MSAGLLMKYFVLKPFGNDPYARASRSAMRRYAKLIETTNPELADDLMSWAIKEQITAFEERENNERLNDGRVE